ncbi:uncharacterized protein LOC114939928 [Nylanderia fulva]|uniref:uncharacterized protein LOC114939928 n=1 Tax=Nylanderia fulva TaxID=613905 RepID=UPI0010FB67CC|nr:uncharacterized protein LOC114939928 [Nylanderia fulva]
MDLPTLIDCQREVQVRIARSVEYLRKLGNANITASAVTTRTRIIDQLWSKFETQHDLIRSGLKDKFNESDYVKSGLHEDTENLYVAQRSLLDGYAEQFQESPPSPVRRNTEGASRSSLPRIKVPLFSGNYADWPSFRDLFLSVIGDNTSISNIERLHHLRSSVTGQAEKLIRSLPVTGDNYDRAWAILSKHYENKRELIRSNFATFVNVSKMKGDTADELSRIHNAATTVVNAQESIGRPIDTHGMDLFNYLVTELFDATTRLEWESSTSGSAEPPSLETLLDFISRRILTLNAVRPKAINKHSGEARAAKSHVTKHGPASPQCALCREKHTLMACREFKAKSSAERKTFVETNKLCYNCLGNHFLSRCQSKKNCFTCNARHHTMLHEAHTASPASEVNRSAAASASSLATTLATTHQSEDRKAILLATARVNIADRYGSPHAVRALLDQGSELSIISETVAQRLRLPRVHTGLSIFGVGGARPGPTRGKVTLNISSDVTNAKLSVVAYVLPRLLLTQGPASRTNQRWPHIQGLQLADPTFQDDDPAELLLGAEVCSFIIEAGVRKGGPEMPIAQKTMLGWILSGGSDATATEDHRRTFRCTADYDLADLVRRFWEQEQEPTAVASLTPDEQRCEELFVRSHTRTAAGRYVVRLPFSSPPTALEETRRPAERLLTAMERRCVQDPRFGDLYRSFMREYEDLRHMTMLNTAVIDRQDKCYLPHHGVFKESSTTTKLRVVFNGSQRTRAGEALNTHLLTGANLLPTLADVLLRWRQHRYVLVADIEKMYRQILVHPDDCRFQTILWRHSPDDEVQEYQLRTVTYGLGCAPFLAIRTLHQLAEDEEEHFPRGAVALRRDCYVDDVVTGATTLEGAIVLQTELRNLCKAGGFPLKKWAANNEEILTGVPQDHRMQQSQHSWNGESHSTLGLRWHPQDDQFSFVLRPPSIKEYTKRHVLSETARLFDPMGWLAPVVIRAKILIQTTWLQGLDWDAPLPTADAHRWQQLLGDLHLLDRLRIPRWLGTGRGDSSLQLHGFADASERGYAAAVYLRIAEKEGTSVKLLMAKSKVAPVKQVTLPRLELCAAALLTTLTQHVQTTLDLTDTPTHLWSDSKVTLQWIQGHASRWKTFVANRVSHIQTLLPNALWRHVAGQDNPADCASRGVTPSELTNHTLWWTGPTWLLEEETAWPIAEVNTQEDDLSERRAVSLLTKSLVVMEPELLLRFSSLHRLLRVTAWCRRWLRTAEPTNTPGRPLTSDELEVALSHWLRGVQALHFPDEVTAISAGRTVATRSPLAKLTPYIDAQGVLRVGGRLKNSLLPQDERHPMIVPATSWLTRLLIDSCHRRTLHGGVQLTLGLLRQRFWVLRGRSAVKQRLHRCVTCTRWRATTPQPPMGNLPHSRVTPTRPFLRTGLDYAGPILIRTSKGRGHRAYKGYIAVFICFWSKAIHLELVSDYSSEAFIAALRRFVSRRGLCTDIFSDCGTTFVGADRTLRELFIAASPEGRGVARAAAKEGIRWHFNPPAAPHFGGLWEAAVKSAKYHLRRVIGETTLTFEELNTLLTQIEACLNSRPLQALSDDPDDVSALTPGHFLIGAPLLAIPEPLQEDEPGSSRSRWQHLQQMRDHFWGRWSKEYIHGLTSRSKWLKNETAPHIGALCLVRSEISPPSRWPLARITKLHHGDDGVVRVVTIKTASSELMRPLVKIVLLPGVEADTTITDA